MVHNLKELSHNSIAPSDTARLSCMVPTACFVTLCLKSQDIEEKLRTYNRNVFIPLPSQTESSAEYVTINIILLMNFAEFFSMFPIIFIDLLLLLRYFDKKYRVSSCIGFEMLFNNYFRKISMEN